MQIENLPIIVIIFDDREIGLTRIKQEIKGIPRNGIALGIGKSWRSRSAPTASRWKPSRLSATR